MRIPVFFSVMLCGVSSAVYAQTATQTVAGLEACFKQARSADAMCDGLANGSPERSDCLQKARGTQLECLQRLWPETSAELTPPPAPAETVRQEKAASGVLPEATPRATTSKPPANAEDTPAKPRAANWVVSETTSPLDFTPLVTALIRSPSSATDAPSTLTVGCRAQRTELLLRTEGAWRVSRGREVRVDYQVDDRPILKRPWTASADGKTATYKDDATGLLQSLPDSARVKVNVFDASGTGHEATFQLNGFDAVRQKIGTACKWPPDGKAG
jgi:hypothetical protein